MQRYLIFFLCLIICRPGLSQEAVDRGQALRDLTGGPTRLVWIQDVGDGSDFLAQREQLRLMALDTGDGQGERVLLEGPRNVAKPMFTPDGERVVFSDRTSQKMFLVDFAGGSPRPLGSGFALHVWRDPETMVDWLYYTKNPITDGKVLQTHEAIYRRALPPLPQSLSILIGRLRGDFEEAKVWGQTHVSEDNFQLSADGRYASTVFPWPEAGILETETGHWHRFGRGCWVSIAPDNSFLFWIFDGPHRNLIMHRAGRPIQERWPVFVAGLPETSDYEVYHPRWSNHPFILTVTGPYKIGDGSNRLAGGGEEVEVHVGRFNADHTAIKQWIKVTDNPYANFYPDVWVDYSHDQLETFTNRVEAWSTQTDADWPLSEEGLVYLWENLDGQTEIHGKTREEGYLCRPEPRGHARYNRHTGMLLDQGTFVDSDAGARALAAIHTNQAFTIELTLYPANATEDHREGGVAAFELDGETPFLIGVQDDRLFYRVNTNTYQFEHLPLGDVHHLAATYSDGRLTFYIDGTPTITELIENLDLSGENPTLVFGGGFQDETSWQGELDGIALYNRTLSPELIQAKSDLRFAEVAARTRPEQVVVRGRLTATTTPPHPDDIAPYRRALISHEYEVVEVLEGEYEEAAILVASWAILDAEVLEDAQRTPGEERLLVLERFDDHPELEGERLAMDTDNLLLDLYFEAEL